MVNHYISLEKIYKRAMFHSYVKCPEGTRKNQVLSVDVLYAYYKLINLGKTMMSWMSLMVNSTLPIQLAMCVSSWCIHGVPILRSGWKNTMGHSGGGKKQGTLCVSDPSTLNIFRLRNDFAGGPAASEARGGFGSQPLPDPARLGRTRFVFSRTIGVPQKDVSL